MKINLNYYKISKPELYETYVVKSSKDKVWLLREMMEGGNMTTEWAFMDSKHNRVETNGPKLKTLGISTFHPLVKKMEWLVRMDCQKEDESSISKFLALTDCMVNEAYKVGSFLPKAGFMADEGGGLQAGLKNKLGDLYDTCVVTCRFHLSQCMSRHA